MAAWDLQHLHTFCSFKFCHLTTRKPLVEYDFRDTNLPSPQCPQHTLPSCEALASYHHQDDTTKRAANACAPQADAARISCWEPPLPATLLGQRRRYPCSHAQQHVMATCAPHMNDPCVGVAEQGPVALHLSVLLRSNSLLRSMAISSGVSVSGSNSKSMVRDCRSSDSCY